MNLTLTENAIGMTYADIRALMTRARLAGLARVNNTAPAQPALVRPPARKTSVHRAKRGQNARLVLEMAQGGLPISTHDLPLPRSVAKMVLLKLTRLGCLRVARASNGHDPAQYVITKLGGLHLAKLLKEI